MKKIEYIDGVECYFLDDKKVTFEEFCSESFEEQVKNKIEELKANCQNYILSIYPIYKQLNIINPLSDYSNEDKFTMNTFIDNQRTICSSKEAEIKNATLENINNISTTFED